MFITQFQPLNIEQETSNTNINSFEIARHQILGRKIGEEPLGPLTGQALNIKLCEGSLRLISHLLPPCLEVRLGVTADEDFRNISLARQSLPSRVMFLLGWSNDVDPGRQDDVLRPVDLVEVDAVSVSVGVEVV